MSISGLGHHHSLPPILEEHGSVDPLLKACHLFSVGKLILEIRNWSDSLDSKSVKLLHRGVEQSFDELMRGDLSFESIDKALLEFDSEGEDAQKCRDQLVSFLEKAKEEIRQEQSSPSSSDRPRQISGAILEAMKKLHGTLTERLEQSSGMHSSLMSSSSFAGSSSSVSAEPQPISENRLRNLSKLIEKSLDRFNEAYDIGNLEDARSELKRVDFHCADAEVCTQLKVKYGRLLKEIISYPSPDDLEVKIKFLAVFFLSQIPIMMRRSFISELKSRVEEINNEIKKIENPLPEEQYIKKEKRIYNVLESLSNERLNAENFQMIMEARRNPIIEYEAPVLCIDKEKLEKRLGSDPKFSNRKDLEGRLSAAIRQAFPDRIISSDFDAPSDVLAVLDKEKAFVDILELNGNELDEKTLIEIINRINQTSLRTLNLFGIAWTCGIANCLADKLCVGAKITRLTIGKPTEDIAQEISDLLLPALVENDSIRYLNIPNSSFSNPSQRETLLQIEKRNDALARVKEGWRRTYSEDPTPGMFYEWGKKFHQQENFKQCLKWFVEAAKLNHIQAIRSVTFHLAGNAFDLKTIRQKLKELSLTLQQLQQWIETLLRENSLTLEKHRILAYSLGQLYENRMIGLPDDRDKMAVKCYSDAAFKDRQLGLVAAQAALVRMSEQGRGIEELLLKIKRGSLPLELSQILAYNLGQLYENGNVGLPNDRDREAVNLYRIAATPQDELLGLVEAQMALARMSEQGRGIGAITDGKKQARYWYGKAALQGNKQAAIEKKRLNEELRRR